MTRIHVNRKGQNLGIFSPEEVAQGLKSGKFVATDLAWSQGMETWLPLSEYPHLPSIENDETLPPTDASDMPPDALPPFVQEEPAWERRKTIGTFKALMQTIFQVLTAPGNTFAQMQREGGLIPPLFCFLLVAIPVQVIGSLYQLATLNPLAIPNSGYQIPKSEQSLILVGTVILSPILFTLMVFIWSWVIHGCLMLVGGANRGFETTYRTLCYTYTGTIVLGLIPFCGGFFTFFAQIYIQTIALKETHGCSMMQSLIATLLPLILCVGCVIALATTLFAMSASMSMGS